MRARVQAFFDAHLGLLELVAGPMPLAVHNSVAQAADCLEFSLSAPDEEARQVAAQAALDAIHGASRLGSAQRAVNRSAKKPGH